jgi:hypothetical protein
MSTSADDNDGPYHFVADGLPLGVPQWDEVTDVEAEVIYEVRNVADDRHSRADRLSGPLADEPDAHCFAAPGLASPASVLPPRYHRL